MQCLPSSCLQKPQVMIVDLFVDLVEHVLVQDIRGAGIQSPYLQIIVAFTVKISRQFAAD